MTGIALSIVLASAFMHAGWNYLTKKSRNKASFIWLFHLVMLGFYLPMLAFYWPSDPIPPMGWACVFATGLLHGFYFLFLGGAYERGDLSLVYPLSRGSGPLLVPILATILFDEQLFPMGILGIALIIIGIYVIHLRSFSRRSFLEPFFALRGSASLWALCTGGTIAGYSLVDKVGVSVVFPPVYISLMAFISFLFLSPYVLVKHRHRLKEEWCVNKGKILVVGLSAYTTYMLILFAFRISKVSYVVAVREVSIVFSTLYGIVWLGEKYAKQKIFGAISIALGVALIGLSH